MGHLKKTQASGALYYQTLKLPSAPIRAPKAVTIKDDSTYVKGESAISYDNLAKPEMKKKNNLLLYVIGGVVLAAICAVCYYLFLLPHGTP